MLRNVDVLEEMEKQHNVYYITAIPIEKGLNILLLQIRIILWEEKMKIYMHYIKY
jgi:hypothetical protein